MNEPIGPLGAMSPETARKAPSVFTLLDEVIEAGRADPRHADFATAWTRFERAVHEQLQRERRALAHKHKGLPPQASRRLQVAFVEIEEVLDALGLEIDLQLVRESRLTALRGLLETHLRVGRR